MTIVHLLASRWTIAGATNQYGYLKQGLCVGLMSVYLNLSSSKLSLL